MEVATRFPEQVVALAKHRPLLSIAAAGDEAGLNTALDAEERREREADRVYWIPLKAELEALRHRRGTP